MLKSGTWMKMGGKWTAMPQMSGMVQGMVSQGMAQGMKNVKNLQCLGSQTYQGAQYNTFSFDSSGETMGIKSSSHIMMYTDGNNRPAWMEIDGKAMGKASKTIQHITFDPSITINPPKQAIDIYDPRSSKYQARFKFRLEDFCDLTKFRAVSSF